MCIPTCRYQGVEVCIPTCENGAMKYSSVKLCRRVGVKALCGHLGIGRGLDSEWAREGVEVTLGM